MAIVLTGFTAEFTRVPFIKPPDLQRMYTAIPRALVEFTVNDGVVPLKPVNDQQNVQIAVGLPESFAYRMNDMVVSIRQDKADDWDDGAQLQVTNALRGQPLGQVNRHLMNGTLTVTFATITNEKLWSLDRVPTYIMQTNRPLVTPVVDFRFTNINATAAAAGVINFFATFYEYDIEQVEMFPPLVPTLTYALA